MKTYKDFTKDIAVRERMYDVRVIKCKTDPEIIHKNFFTQQEQDEYTKSIIDKHINATIRIRQYNIPTHRFVEIII